MPEFWADCHHQYGFFWLKLQTLLSGDSGSSRYAAAVFAGYKVLSLVEISNLCNNGKMETTKDSQKNERVKCPVILGNRKPCRYVHTITCVCVCVCVCVHVYIYIYIYICVCVCIYIY